MRAAWLVLLLLAMTVAVRAERVVVAADGEVVRVSATEPNLLEARDGRVSGFVFTEGAFTETIDTQAGVVYFKPLLDGPQSGFVEIETDEGTRRRFGLVIVAAAGVAAQRIVLAGQPPASAGDYQPLSTSHVAAVKQLLREMLEPGRDRTGWLVERPDPVVVDEQLAIQLVAVVEHPELTGEIHELRNLSGSEIGFTEARLHVRDDIVAIALQKSILAPAARTTVYLVRATEQDELRL